MLIIWLHKVDNLGHLDFRLLVLVLNTYAEAVDSTTSMDMHIAASEEPN